MSKRYEYHCPFCKIHFEDQRSLDEHIQKTHNAHEYKQRRIKRDKKEF